MKTLGELISSPGWALITELLKAKSIFFTWTMKGKRVELTIDLPDQVVMFTGEVKSKPALSAKGVSDVFS